MRNKIVVDISCLKEDMLLINYEAPNGMKRHNHLWNGGNGKERLPYTIRKMLLISSKRLMLDANMVNSLSNILK